MKFDLLFTSVVSALALLPGSHAWGAEGHAIVATIGEMYLEPEVLPILCSILDHQGVGESCTLASVASWADQVKGKMKWSAPMHYVNPVADHPPQLCVFPGSKGWEGKKGANVLAAVRNTTDLLSKWAQQGGDPSDPVANEALRFMIHFVGDMHMPLHLTGRGEGANQVRVKWRGKNVNLHSMWDTNVVDLAVENTPAEWGKTLSPNIEQHLHGNKYDPLIRKIIVGGINRNWASQAFPWIQCPTITNPSSPNEQVVLSQWDARETDDNSVCPWYWANPIHNLTCDWIWPKKLDEPPYNEGNGILLELYTDDYAGKITKEWVVEKLLAMSGVRLAWILNLIFAWS